MSIEAARTLELVRVKLDRRIGTELGGYRIVEQIGRGGTSVVYRAEHVRLGRQAALKLFSSGLGEDDFGERFLRESRLAASLDHPAIVPVYDAGEEDGLLWIAMACVDGTDLKALVAAEGALPLRRALGILAQVAAALDAAHARGLVHRDVKPANILVGPGDRAYLSDFGVAKELASGGNTRTGSFVGTIEYCAPEQIEGAPVDARTDVYALACVLYEALTGQPPFHRPTEVAVLNAHLHSAPPKLGRGFPAELDRVLEKALSKSPADRYPSCGALVAAARAASAEWRVRPRRLALSLALLVLAALLGAAAALGVRSLVASDKSVTTVSTAQLTPQKQPFDPRRLLELEDGRSLNDIGFILVEAHRYRDALPILQKAVRRTDGSTVTGAYSRFNLGLVLVRLNRCAEGIGFLRQALPHEPADEQPFVRRRITFARHHCGRGAASSRTQSR
jgi:serine/threonine protein kinase